MSRALTITIRPVTRVSTTRTCVWEQRTVLQWRTTITNDFADRIRAAIADRAPDVWHLENDESDEWEFIDEDDMQAVTRLMAEDTQLPDLTAEMPEGCQPVDAIIILVN
jgi:hypothetical protein